MWKLWIIEWEITYLIAKLICFNVDIKHGYLNFIKQLQYDIFEKRQYDIFQKRQYDSLKESQDSIFNKC